MNNFHPRTKEVIETYFNDSFENRYFVNRVDNICVAFFDQHMPSSELTVLEIAHAMNFIFPDSHKEPPHIYTLEQKVDAWRAKLKQEKEGNKKVVDAKLKLAQRAKLKPRRRKVLNFQTFTVSTKYPNK